MAEDVYVQKLERFKNNEQPEAILVIADDEELVRIAVAWSTTHIERKEELSPFTGDSESDAWEWLWRNTDYGCDELMRKTGVNELWFDEKLRQLIANRVIYPDGTVNSFVQRYLREKVLKLFDPKPKRPARARS